MKANNAIVKKAQPTQNFSAFITSDAIKGRINALVADQHEGAQFLTSIVSAVTNNPALQGCAHISILNCALLGQSLKLSPSPQLGQYYMVPFNDKEEGMQAQFILGYKGYVQLAIRSGYYRKLNVVAIKEGELVRYDPLEEEIEVRLMDNETEREKAKTVGYFAMFEYKNGFRKTLYWSREKMQAHAEAYSKGYQKDIEKGTNNTFWAKDFDGMATKTMLRQLISKWGIMSVDLQKAVEADTEAIAREDANFVSQEDAAPVPIAEAAQDAAEPQDDPASSFFGD